ncbi:hypothetical protein GGQ54_001094 [Naumannella cuiyingiana]|uniref:ABC-2 type transport system permease protein n=1 Tax=Naumannella cuiyingiana TaxID=1347891 RepID=A0A7Z0IKE7_9ACTN|nr:hypothetical protein [Naumannella cuiyingiana]NYI70534.1 hypothetical protein [Naumannella cuiyingiana]
MSQLLRALAAERLRSRRTVIARLGLAGLVICTLQGAGWWLVSVRDATGWDQLLAWQVIYVTALAAPLVALVAALAVRRDRAARFGATSWRPVQRPTLRLARALWIAGQLLVFNLAITLPVLVIGSVAGLGAPPVDRILWLVMISWSGALPVLGLALLAAERIGLFGTLGLAVVWQIAGTVLSESGAWFAQPWTWAVRAALPVLGIHANGVAAQSGDLVLGLASWPPALLAAIAGIALIAAAAFAPEPRGRIRPGAATRPGVTPPELAPSELAGAAGSVRRGHPAPVAAAWVSLRRTALVWALVPAGAGLVAVYLLWQDAGVRGAFGLLVVPVAAATASWLVVAGQADALRVVLTRCSATAWCGAIAVLLVLCWLPLVAAAGVLSARPGVALAGLVVGIAGLFANLWLGTRFGPGVAIGISVVGVVFGLLFGGSTLAEGWAWLLGPAAWAYSGATPERLAVVVPVALAAAAAGFWLWARAVRTAAAS